MAAQRQRECADDHDQQFQHAADRGWRWCEIQLGRVLAMHRCAVWHALRLRDDRFRLSSGITSHCHRRIDDLRPRRTDAMLAATSDDATE